MALAGVTGGELRIKDTVPEDLRMIRLCFERLGLRERARRDDVLVPGGQKLVCQRDVGELQAEDRGRSVAGLPGRPHRASRWRSPRSPRARS